jgi:hypothetical protein
MRLVLFLFCWSVALGCSLDLSRPTAKNLLANPGFESGALTPWRSWNGMSVVEGASARTGRFAAQVVYSDAGPCGGSVELSTLSVGQFYAFSAWGRISTSTQGQGRAVLGVRYRDAAGETLGDTQLSSAFSSSYQPRLLTFRVPPGARTVVLLVKLEQGGTLDLDDVGLHATEALAHDGGADADASPDSATDGARDGLQGEDGVQPPDAGLDGPSVDTGPDALADAPDSDVMPDGGAVDVLRSDSIAPVDAFLPVDGQTADGGSPNLLQNASFESGSIAPWTSWPGLSAVQDGNARTGSWAAKLTYNAAKQFGGGALLVALSAGKSYRYSVWGKATQQVAVVGLKFYSAGYQLVGSELRSLPFDASYGQRTIDFTLPPSAVYAQLYALADAPELAYIDDVRLTQTSP